MQANSKVVESNLKKNNTYSHTKNFKLQPKMKNLFYLLIISIFLFSCKDDFTMLELDKQEITMKVGEVETLEIIKFSPSKPEHYKVSVNSEDSSIVKIENGNLVAIRQGQTTIKVMVEDVAATCQVTVSGVYDEKNDIYLVGSGDNNNAIYIVNGITYELPSEKKLSSATCIDIQGKNIYIGGYEYNPSGQGEPSKAVLWINGENTRLSDDGNVTGVAVLGNDIYAVGQNTSTESYSVATIWKNGTPIRLNPMPTHVPSFANAISILNSDIYVVGHCYVESNNWKMTAVYWKNGNMMPLSSKESYAIDITTSGDDFYICGREIVNGVSVAKYWKNGVEFNLSDGIQNCSAARIAVEGNDVYIAGYEELKKDFNVPVYWKNGVKQFSSKEMILGHAPLIAVSKDNIYFISSLFYAYENLYLKNNQNFYFCGKPYLHANAIKLVGK